MFTRAGRKSYGRPMAGLAVVGGEKRVVDQSCTAEMRA